MTDNVVHLPKTVETKTGDKKLSPLDKSKARVEKMISELPEDATAEQAIAILAVSAVGRNRGYHDTIRDRLKKRIGGSAADYKKYANDTWNDVGKVAPKKGKKQTQSERPDDWQPPYDDYMKFEVSYPFSVADDGVLVARTKKIPNEGDVEQEYALCRRIDFVAKVRTFESDRWALWVKVTAEDGTVNDVFIPARDIGTPEPAKALREAGAWISGHAGNDFNILLADVKPKNMGRMIEKGGWHETGQGPVYALTDPEGAVVYGSDFTEPVIYRTPGKLRPAYNVGGTLADWQEHIGKAAIGNSRLEFALCTAFAAPLMTPLGVDPGGFHLVGGSSIGKTIAARVAGSVFGGPDYIHTHRGTDNALENVAEMHNDALLVLDEISQADSGTIGESMYMLGNGQGKNRASANAEARETKTFRNMTLSTGEVTMADKIREDRYAPNVKGGQSVRFVDVVADAGKGMGVAEDPHGQSPREFMDALKQASRRFYGTAVRAFLEHQASSPENILATARQRMAAFVRVAVPAGADGQVYRVAERFALCGAAGELAIEAGVLPWATGAADAVCQRMFGEWLAARGGAGSFEVAQGVKAVHEFIIEQGAACFFDSTKPDLIIRDRVGWIEHEWKGHEVVYIVPSSQWPKLCGGYDPNGVAKALADAGDLLAAESGEYTHSLRTPWDKKKVRCRVLVADSDEEPLGEPWASLTRELSGGAA